MALGLAALWGGACTATPPLTLTNPPRSGFCVFPQACYVTDCACDSGAACRVLGFDEKGQPRRSTADPQPTDAAVLCQVANGGTPDGGTPDGGSAGVECRLPEQVCVARGVVCSTACVGSGGSCEDANVERFVPQRRGGDGGMQTYCPRLDQRCCPVPDGGMPIDASVPDASAPADLMSQPG